MPLLSVCLVREDRQPSPETEDLLAGLPEGTELLVADQAGLTYCRAVSRLRRQAKGEAVLVLRGGERPVANTIAAALAQLSCNPRVLAVYGGGPVRLVTGAAGLLDLFCGKPLLPRCLVRTVACHRFLPPVSTGLPDQWRELALLVAAGPVAVANGALTERPRPAGAFEEQEALVTLLADQQVFVFHAMRMPGARSMEAWQKLLLRQRAAALTLVAQELDAAGNGGLAMDMRARASFWGAGRQWQTDSGLLVRAALSLVVRLALQMGDQVRRILVEADLGEWAVQAVAGSPVPLELAIVTLAELTSYPAGNADILVFARSADALERRQRIGGAWPGYQFAVDDLITGWLPAAS